MSRIILERFESFLLFIRCTHPGHPGLLLDEVEVALSREEIIQCIKSNLPEIDFDPDMHQHSPSFADTILRPDASSDVVVIDYHLVRLLKAPYVADSEKLAGLLFFAILLGRKLAQVLEFRCIRGGDYAKTVNHFKLHQGQPPESQVRRGRLGYSVAEYIQFAHQKICYGTCVAYASKALRGIMK